MDATGRIHPNDDLSSSKRRSPTSGRNRRWGRCRPAMDSIGFRWGRSGWGVGKPLGSHRLHAPADGVIRRARICGGLWRHWLARVGPFASRRAAVRVECSSIRRSLRCAGGSSNHGAVRQPDIRKPRMGNTARHDRCLDRLVARLRSTATYAASCSAFLRVLARTFSLSYFSWPQAARMSRPRGVRMGLA